VSSLEFLGEIWRVYLKAGGQQIFADLPLDRLIKPGDSVVVGWENNDGRIYL
jgi:hypothetical protein